MKCVGMGIDLNREPPTTKISEFLSDLSLMDDDYKKVMVLEDFIFHLEDERKGIVASPHQFTFSMAFLDEAIDRFKELKRECEVQALSKGLIPSKSNVDKDARAEHIPVINLESDDEEVTVSVRTMTRPKPIITYSRHFRKRLAHQSGNRDSLQLTLGQKHPDPSVLGDIPVSSALMMQSESREKRMRNASGSYPDQSLHGGISVSSALMIQSEPREKRVRNVSRSDPSILGGIPVSSTPMKQSEPREKHVRNVFGSYPKQSIHGGISISSALMIQSEPREKRARNISRSDLDPSILGGISVSSAPMLQSEPREKLVRNIVGSPLLIAVKPPVKQRKIWSLDMHRRYLQAVNTLGGPLAATPTKIKDYMHVAGITEDDIRSHMLECIPSLPQSHNTLMASEDVIKMHRIIFQSQPQQAPLIICQPTNMAAQDRLRMRGMVIPSGSGSGSRQMNIHGGEPFNGGEAVATNKANMVGSWPVSQFSKPQ